MTSAIVARLGAVNPLRRLLAPPTIGRYLGRAYLTRFLILLVSVTVVLQLLDVLTESEDILRAPGAGYASVATYIKYRFPQLVSEFTPFTALLAALLLYVMLNQHSEVVVMKAAGLSAYQIVAPLMLVSVGIAVVHFVFNEAVVTRSTAQLRHWQANDYAVDLPAPPQGAVQSWLLDRGNFIGIKSIARNGALLVIDDVTIYERGEDGQLTSVAKADFAIYREDGWTLFELRRFDLATKEMTSLARSPWDTSIPPGRFMAMAVAPEQVTFGELFSAIVRLESEGYPTRFLSASLHHKIASPAATILMPLLAALAAFGVVRGGQLFLRATVAMAFGFAYFIVDNLLLAMGQFGRMPPLLAAWSPFLLFFGAGLLVLVYTED